jgi:hypothetical protein
MIDEDHMEDSIHALFEEEARDVIEKNPENLSIEKIEDENIYLKSLETIVTLLEEIN